MKTDTTITTESKKPYVSPALTEIGTLENITQGGGPKGSKLDANFAIGTKVSDITFS